ncbi:MAG: hybrid histidine protein kinase/response regulator SinK [Myxococcota bacterium]|nr:hybrid histidine protein kinase/response regulator SinK [Myxococcota bacterium]
MPLETPLDALRRALAAGDLAAARTAEQALRKAGSTQLAAEVLHELRQPLLGIKAYGQMMADEGSAKGPIHQLLAQVERMEQIISDFTRLASEKPPPKEKTRLGTAVEKAASLFRLNPESALISLEVDAAPELELLANPRLLEQLTLNLMNNARDAMGGRGKLKVIATRGEKNAPVLMVADWGPGIPPELRERIFDPYLTTKSKGSGLGLAVCKRIAKEHDAVIALVHPEQVHDVPPPATVFKVTFAGGPAPAVQRRRLLVVDDEEIIRMVFRDLMGKECEITEAATAEEALEHLRHSSFDLVVTDKNLPGLSGLELAQEARRMNPASKVILMTGYPSVVTAQQATELGVMDYLLKPFDEIREVREKLRHALAASAHQDFQAQNRRVDVYEDNPTTSHQVSEALSLLGYEANILTEPRSGGDTPPAGVVVSWDFGPAHGRAALELARQVTRGAPFVVLAEHLTMESAIDSLRGGAVACLPKLISDTKALSRELARALKLKPITP